MKIDIAYKKELLIRKNYCKKYYEDYLIKIKKIFNMSDKNIFFKELNITDDIKNTSFINNKVKYIKNDISYPSIEFSELIQTLKQEFSNSFYVYIDEDWKYCGTFLIPNLSIINIKEFFGNIITDDLRFISEDKSIEILLDYADSAGEQWVEYTLKARD